VLTNREFYIAFIKPKTSATINFPAKPSLTKHAVKLFNKGEICVSSVKHGEANFYWYGIDFSDIARMFVDSGLF
jgi:hypothetical protein